MKSHVIVKEEPSCAISSLDFSGFKDNNAAANNCFDFDSDFNDDPFEDDDDDDVNSVPKSPAPLMEATCNRSEVHLLAQDNSDASHDDDNASPKEQVSKTKKEEAITEATRADEAAEAVNNTGDSVTVTCSNSNKQADHLKDRNDRSAETTLSPQKNHVAISDGSISTKDSILGKMINVANSDFVTERIYLESLRAQVLAELKVHVADEEIRLALDARLQAIQDYYKRKATVFSLGKVTASKPAMASYPRNSNDHDFIDGLGDLPKVKPTVIHANALEESPASSPPSYAIPYPQQQQNSHKFAFERVQGQIDEAIKEAHNSPKESSAFLVVKHAEEEKVPEEEEEEEAPCYDRQATETPIPLHIFTKDTFWDDEDDPSTMIFSSSTAGASPGAAGGIEMSLPPTHADTIHNAWGYYSNINALIFDSRIYDYEFQNIQDDALYPYLNSLMGIADGGEDGYSNEHKRISQKVKREYVDKSPHRICHSLAREAEVALPELKAICAYIGNKLGMQTMAVGPMKKPSEALLKCEKKYGGDPLLVTDYCRASLFVKDVSTLLALIEIVLSKYSRSVRRIKLSTLKSDHVPLVGGYRDCKINIDIGGHICEIQVHLISMWLIRESGGYGHYKECCEHNVDTSSFDIGLTLSGLDRDTLTDLIKAGESATKRTPIVALKQFNEDKIRDYFALANLHLYYGHPDKAEYILRRTVKLRSESSEFGPCHAETMLHLELLRKSLKCQHKYKSASSVKNQISKVKKMQRNGNRDANDVQPKLSELCTSDQCGAIGYVCDMILDPSRKDRQEEKQKADAVEESRALWLKVRRSFFN